MPIYEYKCCDCKHFFSVLQSLGSSEKDTKCQKCGSENIKKKLSSFSCTASEASGFAPMPASSMGRGGG